MNVLKYEMSDYAENGHHIVISSPKTIKLLLYNYIINIQDAGIICFIFIFFSA